MRRDLIVLITALGLLGSSIAAAQFGRRFGRRIEDHQPKAPTEFVAMRWHFGTNGAIGHMGWSHNYPESELNLNEFIGRTTRIDVEDDAYRLLELSRPEIFDYPFAYVSEPGEMEMTEAEVANLREYIDRGGEDLQSMAPYVQGDDPVYYALVNDVGQIAVMALHNNDLANFWEWYGSPQYPLKPATDAFRMGTNFVVHAMTH